MSGRLDFSVRTAIVTGAASGMGRATAEAFAAAGANVLLADVSDVLGAEAARAIRARGGQALYQSCDVRSEDQVRALVERAVAEFGGLDFMVNNAAVLGEWVPIADQTAPNLDLVLDVNVKGVVYGMKHALAAMRPRRRGVIVRTGLSRCLSGRGVLCREQGRGGLAHQVRGARIRQRGDPRGRHRAGTHRHADAAQPDR
jgi:NAD(P)-dependent dehydrogenase (short-subunit alcohol dehydrogenase family)